MIRARLLSSHITPTKRWSLRDQVSALDSSERYHISGSSLDLFAGDRLCRKAKVSTLGPAMMLHTDKPG